MTDGIGSRVGTEHGLDTATSPWSVAGSGLPFSITGSAAPPFRKPMKLYADTALRLARNRTRRRIGRSRAIRAEGAKA